MSSIEFEEIALVAFLVKEIFSIVAAIVDVVILSILEWGWAGHWISPCSQDSDKTLKVSEDL